jgi:hypothetical protein
MLAAACVCATQPQVPAAPPKPREGAGAGASGLLALPACLLACLLCLPSAVLNKGDKSELSGWFVARKGCLPWLADLRLLAYDVMRKFDSVV